MGDHFQQLFQLAPQQPPPSPPQRRRLHRASVICNVALLGFLIGCLLFWGLSRVFPADLFFFDFFLLSLSFLLLFIFVLIGAVLTSL